MLLKNYAVVFHDVLLFNASVMDNIKIGKKDATEEEVKAVARLARCDEFIARLPNGYDTLIGENGESAIGRRTPTHIHCPCASQRCSCHPLGRSNGKSGRRERNVDTGRYIGVDQEQDRRHHRTPYAHRCQRSSYRGAERRNRRRTRSTDELLARNGEFARMVARQKETGI